MPRLSVSPLEMSDTEIASVFERYARDREPADREILVLRYLRLAQYLARKYDTGADREDLEQVASLGLLKALERFDPGRGLSFTTFAVPTILGELKRHFRDRGWTVRVPRSLQELVARVDSATEQLAGQLGRSPTVEEIAGRCEISAEQVLDALGARTAHRPDSLDRPLLEDDGDTVAVSLPAVEAGYERAERAIDMSMLLATLPPREQYVLRLRFEEDLVQRDIAERLGMSQMHVSRLIRQAIETLRDAAEQTG
jgi:RNA polymerase sigma-B factor